MNEVYLPWWLALLIGMWVVSLTIWQHPSSHREMRLWAGLLTLVYFGLFFIALSNVALLDSSSASDSRSPNIARLCLIASAMASLSAGVWFVGRVDEFSRRFSYCVATLANACAAFSMQSPWVACGLLVIVASTAIRLIREMRVSQAGGPSFPNVKNWIQFPSTAVASEQIGVFWLYGGMTAVVACLMLGTAAYSMRYEVSRSPATSRLPALPSPDDIRRETAASNQDASLIDLMTGVRAEIVVLLAVIVFLCLAIPQHRFSETPQAGDASMNHDSQQAETAAAKGLQ